MKHWCTTDAHSFPCLLCNAKMQPEPLLQYCTLIKHLALTRNLITEVSRRINFSPWFNENNLKPFAAVIIFDLSYHSKKFPHSSDTNCLGTTTLLFSSQETTKKHQKVIILYVGCAFPPFTKNHQLGTTCNSITWCLNFSLVIRHYFLSPLWKETENKYLAIFQNLPESVYWMYKRTQNQHMIFSLRNKILLLKVCYH